jgi:mannose-6-phosphate isomerase class I
MRTELIFLTPIFKRTIWGGDRLKTELGLAIPDETTGEAWIASAHPNGDCHVANGAYKGGAHSTLWARHRKLFGEGYGDEFPLLVKFIDAKADLSIQVHPDNEYAKKFNSSGKSECWYILDSPGEIIIGHNAFTKEEFREMAENNRWSDLLRVQKARAGDFFQIDPGCVHSLKAGTLLLEIQQNSDLTFRLYDYDRETDGKRRKLHLKEALDVITVPHAQRAAVPSVERLMNATRTKLFAGDHYTVHKLDIAGDYRHDFENGFSVAVVLDGAGDIDGTSLRKGQSFIIPRKYDKCIFSGRMSVILATPGPHLRRED